jgi:Flp pilus assembly protein TadG
MSVKGRRKERGSILVETAAILPILFLLLAGIFDFGRVYGQYQTITNAAREGARYASSPYPYSGSNPPATNEGKLPANSDVVAVIESRLSAGGIDPNTATITVTQAAPGTSDSDGYCSGDATLSATCSVVTVQVPINYRWLHITKGHLTATARMRNETN